MSEHAILRAVKTGDTWEVPGLRPEPAVQWNWGGEAFQMDREMPDFRCYWRLGSMPLIASGETIKFTITHTI